MLFIEFTHRIYLILVAFFILCSCQSNQMAPVEERNPQYAMSHPESSYVVRNGDTLYAIAFLYDQNVKQLAELNGIPSPYRVQVGQTIKLLSFKSAHASRGNHFNLSSFHRQYMNWRTPSRTSWLWPTQGSIASRNFNNPIELKGINIIGRPHQTVVAAARGIVAYAGNGLPGYGNLVLIKHSNDYLTAYAFNSTLYVREGQPVQAGQKIASMGMLDSSHWGLHFEIRYHGQTLNPLKFLPGR